MSLTLNELSLNEFEDHSGRPGQRGGSLPRSGVPGLTMKVLRQQASLQGKSVEQLVDEAKRGEFQQVSGGGRSSTSGPAHRYAPPPPVLSDDEISQRLHYSLKSADPSIRIRAKSAKALIQSPDEEIQKIGKRRLSEIPRPSQSEIEAEQTRALNPFHDVPEMEKGESFSGHALRAITYLAESLDKPGRAVRGVLGGKYREAANIIPFSDSLGITKEEDQVSGRDLLEKVGMVGPNVEGFDWGDVGGAILEIATDPLMYIGGIGGVAKAVKAPALSAQQLKNVTAKALKAGRKGSRAYKAARKAARESAMKYAAKKAGNVPLQFGTGAAKGRISKAQAEAAAAQARKVAQAGKYNPAAAAMLIVKAFEKSPIGGELLRRLREGLAARGGKMARAIADAKVPKTVTMFGKQIPTGVKREGTTVRRLVRRANTKITGQKRVADTIAKAQRYARYANEAHLAGEGFLQSSGVKAEKERLRQRAREEKAAKSASRPATITPKMQQRLRDIGYTDSDIRLMKPEDAWKNLGNVTNVVAPKPRALYDYAGRSTENPIDQAKRVLRKYTKKKKLFPVVVTNTLVANFYGGVRKAKYQGKDYLVAPLSLIVEGVLNGSKGALHYPMTEMKKSCQAWNNTPIVVYHPMDAMGRPQRAKGNPDVLNRSGIGVVRNARISGNKLVAEGWFDLSRTQKIDSRVYNALLSQQKMELSTGLDTDNEQKQGVWNGRNYVMIARNYRPDHLAILPDQIGACSVQDGCGLMVANMKMHGRRSTNVIDLRTTDGSSSLLPSMRRNLAKALRKKINSPKSEVDVAQGKPRPRIPTASSPKHFQSLAPADPHTGKLPADFGSREISDATDKKVRAGVVPQRTPEGRATWNARATLGMLTSSQKTLVANCHCNNTCQKCREQSGYVINPFVSEAQRRYMYAKHPEIAKRWSKEMKKKGEPVVKPDKRE